MIATGDRAPDFELPDSDMQMLRSADLAGQNYVLYFYPKDDTPGCTLEAQEFSDLSEAFAAADTLVIGVSKDTCVSHAVFRDKFGLTIQLAADVEGQLCEAYDVWREKEKDGVKRMGIVRSTFVVDKVGTVRLAAYDIKPKGHAAAVLQVAKSL